MIFTFCFIHYESKLASIPLLCVCVFLQFFFGLGGTVGLSFVNNVSKKD